MKSDYSKIPEIFSFINKALMAILFHLKKMARRIYDNWERLVEAVLKREQMWEMFHAPSRTPSISSLASDTSFGSSLDHPLLDLSFNDAVSQLPFLDTVKSDEKFESRKHVEEEILRTLLRDDVNTIGIYGTGGIGKTTMAKRIGEMVMKEKIFDEVILTVVSQQPDIKKIQSDIAEVLGLKLEEKSLQVRASQLNNIIKDLSNILIIVDDVCASLQLEDVGIPSCSSDKRCKIMFTSQNQDVLEAMQVQKVFPVQVLSDDEAWILFKEKVGNKAEDPGLQPFAKVFAKECKGMPLALDILGLALQGKDKPFWEDALVELRSCAPVIPQVPDHVYQPLKLSCMWLSDEEKSLFILCCLFEEDSDIFLEELVRFGMGLDMFDGITSLEEARSRVSALTTILKKLSLLEDGRDQVSVKMHDVVRNVAISIASEGNHVYMVNHDARLISWAEKISYEKYTHISLISTVSIELSEELVCPNLHFLRLQCNLNENLREGKPLAVPDNIFKGMRELNVFVMSDIYIESLPPSLHLITHLRTLHLHSCSVKSISLVGQLVNLEILSCYDCHGIEVLPAEIGRLNRLRLLELYQCQHLKTIAPGVISSLVLLEELKMRGSFAQWQASGGQEKTNAALSELQSLSLLINLEIEVEDPKVISTDIHLFPYVTKFCIIVGTGDKISRYNEVPLPYKIIDGPQYMQLSLPNESTPGHWIHDLLKRTEDLSLTGNGSIKLVFEEFEKVKKLRFCHCSTMSHLLSSSNEGVFRVLESLDLEDITNLQEVCHGPLPVGSFLNLRDLKLYEMPALLHLWKNPDQNFPLTNLRSIDIRNCKVLPYLFTLSIARSFVQLEELRILFCGMMKELLLNDLNKSTGSIAFPRLKKLILNSLPSLVDFSRNIESMKFPQLHFLSIRNLPKLQGFLPRDGSLPVFFNQKVEFDSLKELSLHGLDDTISQIWSLKIPMNHFSELQKLHICACNKLKTLFSPSIARALVILKELDIKDSLMMTEVIVNVEKETEKTLFPSLERMELWRLRSLRSFCQWKQDLELPSLRLVNICMCPEMQTFTLGSLSTPNLEHFQVDNKLIEIKDLNGAIGRRHFRAKLEPEASSSTARKRTGKEKTRR
ncbi:hypothetical protein Pfo_000959 [Paulownia fortunei]|nr:hypothetical protein Pfo_000959 [Paulownia fortunei]